MKPSIAHLFGRSLRARLVLLFSLVLVPPVLIAWGKAMYDYYDQRENLQRLLLQRAQLVATEREDLIQGARSLLKALAELPEANPLGTAQCETNLRNALMRNPEYQSLLVLDTEGHIACASRSVDRGMQLRDRDWFRAALAGSDFFLSQPMDSRVSGARIMAASVPLRSADGRVVGVIAVGIPWERLTAPIAMPDIPKDASLALLDRSGAFHLLHAANGNPAPPAMAASTMSALATGSFKDTPPGRIVDSDNMEWAVAPFADGALYMALGRPRANIDQELNFRLLLGLSLPALIWVAAVATAWLAANRLIVRWVLRVREYAASIAAGRPIDLDERLGEAPSELQELAASLRRMMETIQQRNGALAEALDHRETLIKEIHHRVKNNLQIIASLLNLQMRAIGDGGARDAMMTVRNRVNALALIHRSLYETDELQRVEFRSFLGTLVDQVSEFLDAPARHIDVKTDIPVVYVQAETAVTLALLATEALSNAFKHAFPADRDGHISIKLTTSGDGAAVLTIADNGIGEIRPPSAGGESHGVDISLGHQLMLGYARQLGGELTTTREAGTVVRIDLPNLTGVSLAA